MAQLPNPFSPPAKSEPRVKTLVFGGPGAGKTYLALGAPGPIAVIDTEGGTAFYEGRKGLSAFERLTTKSYAEVKAAVEYLATGDHPYQTLVIDPVTIIYETLQASALIRRAEMNRRRSRGSSDPDEADLEMLDWGRIKRSYKSLMTALVNLDMHVIVTAREKAETVRGNDGEMHPTGRYLADTEKGTAYFFDVVLRLVDEDGRRVAIVAKDRTAEESAVNARIVDPTFTSLFADVLKRKGKGHRTVPDDEEAAVRDAAVEEEGQHATPAAIAQMVELVEQAGKDPAQFLATLGLESWDQASAVQVAKLAEKARTAIAAAKATDGDQAATEAEPAAAAPPTRSARNGRSRKPAAAAAEA